MQALNICILGGTGFVGSHLAAQLAACGHGIKILCRHRERHRDLLVVPGISLVEADIFDREQLRRHFSSCDAVINLVGILNEKGHRGDGFQQLHVELAKRMLDACLYNRVPRLLQMSALNADARMGPSFYLRSKGEAEDFLLSEGRDKIALTSFRPSVIFGANDHFFNRFAGLLKLSPLIFPLACPEARFAPVYVGDVVSRICAALADRSSYGKTYDLCGPGDYSLLVLVRYCARLLGLKTRIIGLPDSLSKLQAHIFEWLPGKPFSLDNYHSLSVNSLCASARREPTRLESVVPSYLNPRDRLQHYHDYRKIARP